MLRLPRTVRVWAYPRPTDLRKGYNGLYGLVQNGFGPDPVSGEYYLFTNANRTLCTVLVWDGTGLCIFMKRPVLIMDESHHLRTDVLEELRLLTYCAMDSENRLCVVLVGHLELRRRLNMAALDALAQRIVVRAHMRGLTRAETVAYVEHQLGHAGCKHLISEPSAIEAIYQATSGLPRRTNLLAHHALLAAAIAKANNVSAEHVQAALNELA